MGGVGAAGAFDMSSSNFGGTIIGEATRAAVDSLTSQVVAVAPQISETKVEIHALIADVSGGDIIINVGTSAGVKIGAEYDVIRPGREIKDPATGRVLRRVTTAVGKLKVTSADESSAQGTLTGGPAKVGDCVGACPANTPDAPPPSGGSGPAEPAAAGPATRAAGPLPTLYTAPISGAFSWGMYALKGTEHFKYDVSETDGGQTKIGTYTFDAARQGNGVMLTINGSLGSDSYSSTAAITPGQGIPMMQLASMGPAAAVMFSPMYSLYFGGRQMQLGTGWSQTHNGKTSSFKVESTCAYGGVSGLRGVMRENGAVIVDMCISPNVGLPLAVTMGGESGSNGTTMKLVEFRP